MLIAFFYFTPIVTPVLSYNMYLCVQWKFWAVTKLSPFLADFSISQLL